MPKGVWCVETNLSVAIGFWTTCAWMFYRFVMQFCTPHNWWPCSFSYFMCLKKCCDQENAGTFLKLWTRHCIEHLNYGSAKSQHCRTELLMLLLVMIFASSLDLKSLLKILIAFWLLFDFWTVWLTCLHQSYFESKFISSTYINLFADLHNHPAYTYWCHIMSVVQFYHFSHFSRIVSFCMYVSHVFSLFFIHNIVHFTLFICSFIDPRCLHIPFITMCPPEPILISSPFCILHFHVLMHPFIKFN
jgi:hypothetical protein